MVKPKPWKACWVWIELATFSLIRIIVTVVLIITNILPFDAKPVLTFPSFVSFYRSTGFGYCSSAAFWKLVWASFFVAWISGRATNVAFSIPRFATRFCQLMNLQNSTNLGSQHYFERLVTLYYLDINCTLRIHLSYPLRYYWWLGIDYFDHRSNS